MVDNSKIKAYFRDCLNKFGATPQGLDWNSTEAIIVRYEQLLNVLNRNEPYTVIDYGCGYGMLYDILKSKGDRFEYIGFDLVEDMIRHGQKTHQGFPDCVFTFDEKDLVPSDYIMASGIFNVKLDHEANEWREYIIQTILKMNKLALKGLAFNMLTIYSDPEYMRPDLFYGDPCFFFDFCKRNLSKNVALLHNYGLFDFTILVQK